jgi:hypothetical protein
LELLRPLVDSGLLADRHTASIEGAMETRRSPYRG